MIATMCVLCRRSRGGGIASSGGVDLIFSRQGNFGEMCGHVKYIM
jgi:hypothetical protein